MKVVFFLACLALGADALTCPADFDCAAEAKLVDVSITCAGDPCLAAECCVGADNTNIVPATDPSATDPPATDPPATDPPATDTSNPYGDGNVAGDVGEMFTSPAFTGQAFSTQYGKVILELQAAWTWVQAAESMYLLARGGYEPPVDVSGVRDLLSLEEKEKDDDDSDDSFLELEEVVHAGDNFGAKMLEMVERDAEQALLRLTKLMYVQAGQMLSDAQNSHYYVKAITAYIGTEGEAAQLTYLLYYRDMLQMIMGVVAIQKQDMWNFWIFNEMIETDITADGIDLPEEFEFRMAASRLQAMSQFQLYAGCELAAQIMDFYIIGVMSKVQGTAAAKSSMFQTLPPIQSSSFLEMGMQTQTQAGAQFVPSMALGGLFGWGQFMPYIKLYSAWVKYLVSSQLAMVSQIDSLALVGKDHGQASKKSQVMAMQVMPALKQWTHLRLMIALHDFYGKTGAMPGQQAEASHHSAQFNNLMQQDASSEPSPAMPAMPVVAEKDVSPPELQPVATPKITGVQEAEPSLVG